MLTIRPSFTETSWLHPTAQYGQTLGTSLMLANLNRRVSAWAARRAMPRRSIPPAVRRKAVARKTPRRSGRGEVSDMIGDLGKGAGEWTDAPIVRRGGVACNTRTANAAGQLRAGAAAGL